MKSRRLNVPEDRETILGCHSRTSNSTITTAEYSEPIPHDLIIEIVLRLPVKSVARCRCVSKLWASILGHSDFTETYLTRSSARPQLLFAYEKDGKVIFLSSPQPQNHDANLSPVAVANFHSSVDHIYSSISGLVCIGDDRILKGRKTPMEVWVICNPSTGQYVTLPKMKTRKRTFMTNILGYDPIGKQHKVLGMTMGKKVAEEHQVLTLGGTRNLTWRMIECGIPHSPPGQDSICINGVLYYITSPHHYSTKNDMIVCFHVRSEKFSFIKVMEPFTGAVYPHATLINYNGKLASVKSEECSYINESHTSFEVWVLQDPEKQEWSKHLYQLPRLWKHVTATLVFVGMTGANEIVLSPRYLSDPFYVFYYSLESRRIRRVEIQGIGAFKPLRVYTFVNHVEDVKLMQEF